MKSKWDPGPKFAFSTAHDIRGRTAAAGHHHPLYGCPLLPPHPKSLEITAKKSMDLMCKSSLDLQGVAIKISGWIPSLSYNFAPLPSSLNRTTSGDYWLKGVGRTAVTPELVPGPTFCSFSQNFPICEARVKRVSKGRQSKIESQRSFRKRRSVGRSDPNQGLIDYPLISNFNPLSLFFLPNRYVLSLRFQRPQLAQLASYPAFRSSSLFFKYSSLPSPPIFGPSSPPFHSPLST